MFEGGDGQQMQWRITSRGSAPAARALHQAAAKRGSSGPPDLEDLHHVFTWISPSSQSQTRILPFGLGGSLTRDPVKAPQPCQLCLPRQQTVNLVISPIFPLHKTSHHQPLFAFPTCTNSTLILRYPDWASTDSLALVSFLNLSTGPEETAELLAQLPCRKTIIFGVSEDLGRCDNHDMTSPQVSRHDADCPSRL
jgi:hypothetical protein